MKFEAKNWKFLLKSIVDWIYVIFTIILKFEMLSFDHNDLWRFLFCFFNSNFYFLRIFAKQGLQNLHCTNVKELTQKSSKKSMGEKIHFGVLRMYLCSSIVQNLNVWSLKGVIILQPTYSKCLKFFHTFLYKSNARPYYWSSIFFLLIVTHCTKKTNFGLFY